MFVLLVKSKRMPTITFVISSCPLVATLLKFKVTVVGEAALPPADMAVADELYTRKLVVCVASLCHARNRIEPAAELLAPSA